MKISIKPSSSDWKFFDAIDDPPTEELNLLESALGGAVKVYARTNPDYWKDIYVKGETPRHTVVGIWRGDKLEVVAIV